MGHSESVCLSCERDIEEEKKEFSLQYINFPARERALCNAVLVLENAHDLRPY